MGSMASLRPCRHGASRRGQVPLRREPLLVPQVSWPAAEPVLARPIAELARCPSSNGLPPPGRHDRELRGPPLRRAAATATDSECGVRVARVSGGKPAATDQPAHADQLADHRPYAHLAVRTDATCFTSCRSAHPARTVVPMSASGCRPPQPRGGPSPPAALPPARAVLALYPDRRRVRGPAGRATYPHCRCARCCRRPGSALSHHMICYAPGLRHVAAPCSTQRHPVSGLAVTFARRRGGDFGALARRTPAAAACSDHPRGGV